MFAHSFGPPPAAVSSRWIIEVDGDRWVLVCGRSHAAAMRQRKSPAGLLASCVRLTLKWGVTMLEMRHSVVPHLLSGAFALAVTTTGAGAAAASAAGIQNAVCTCNTPGQVTTYSDVIDTTIANNYTLIDSVEGETFLNDVVVTKSFLQLQRLNDSLTASQVSLLRDVITSSLFLSDNKLVVHDVLIHNTVLKAVLDYLGIDLTKVVAIDLLSSCDGIIVSILD
jgi:hypothetical protein